MKRGRSQDVTAVIVAAGRGRRFGGLKQFAMFRGKPLIYHSIRAFQGVSDIHRIVLVVPAERLNWAGAFVLKNRISKPVDVVAGGRLRQESVQCGLNLVDRGYVAIHDGVRPFVSLALVRQGIRLVRKYKAVVFGRPVTETVRRVAGRRSVGTVNKAGLYTTQTPQFFEVTMLKKAFRAALRKGREFTDDAAVVEDSGIPVYLFSGPEENQKITYRHQLRSIDKTGKPGKLE